MTRIEIAHGDTGWHLRVRASNGRIIAHSETYTRRRGALNAVAVMAEAFGLKMNRPPFVANKAVLVVNAAGRAAWAHVVDVDERTGVAG